MSAIVPLNSLQRHHAPLRGEIDDAVQRVLAGGSYILGEWVERFEDAFAQYCGVQYVVGVGSGTDALLLALLASDIVNGDNVITVANAGGYATNAILRTGATPIYVDIDPSNFLITPANIEAAITTNTRAIIVTHLYGLMAAMPEICTIAEKHNLIVIEDCAQAHGASFDGRRAGAWGTFGCFSFYPTKNLGGLGDAGCITVQDAELAKRLRSLRQYGWQGGKYYSIADIGFNSRMDELQASVLYSMLPHLDEWNQKRRDIVRKYREGLKDYPLYFQSETNDETYVAHLCVARTEQRDELRVYLTKHGIASEVHYPCADYDQQAVIKLLGKHPPLLHTEYIQPRNITLPCFPELSVLEIELVINTIRNFFECHSS